MSEIYMHESVAILPGAGIMVSMRGSSSTTLSKKINKNPILKDSKSGEELAVWGPKNDFPQMINELIEKNPIIGRTLDDKVCMAQGKDVVPVYFEWDDEGKKKLKYINDKEIWDFLDLNSTQNYVNESLTDLFRFYNFFAKCTKSIDGKKILRVDSEEATFSRLSKQDSNGISRKVFINANWPKARISDPETITYDCLNPYAWDLVAEAERLEDEFIFPGSYATPGKVYYQLAHWDGFRNSDWNEVLLLIPKIKKYLMENEITLKFHIELPEYYFAEKLGKAYSQAGEPEKLAMRRKELQAWNDFLSNPENAGKSMASIFKVVNHKDKVPGVSITPIENKLKDGEKLKDNQEAFSLLLYSLGVDPTLLGFNPGEKSSHSGTDKREAHILFLSKIEPYRKKVLAPLNFIAKYNGWTDKYPRMRFVFEDTILTTLDEGKSTESLLSTGKEAA